MQCDACDLRFDRPELFRTVPRSFGKGTRKLCPDCFQKEEKRVHWSVLRSYVALNAIGILLTFLFARVMVGPLILNVGVLAVFMLFCTVLHELGHAAAGRLAGFRIFGIEIGMGRVTSEFHFWGFQWQLRTVLLGGCCYGVPRSTRAYRLRQTLCILGGPMVNAALLVLTAAWFLESDKVFDSGVFKGFIPARLFLICNVTLLLYSLVPFETKTQYGVAPNDALLLWRTWRRTKSQIEDIPAFYYVLEGGAEHRRNNYAKARQWFEEGLRLFPGDYGLQWAAATNLIFLKQYREARSAMALVLGRHWRTPDLRPYVLNGIAYANLLSGEPELLPEADIFSSQAIGEMPGSVHIKTTRGSVLVELGQFDEGTRLLIESLQNRDDRDGQAFNACYLGIAASRSGRADESRHYFALARKLDPNCLLLSREHPELHNQFASETR